MSTITSLKKPVLPVVVNAEGDMYSKAKDAMVPDSWFFVFNLATKTGREFACLVHYMVMDTQIAGMPSVYMTAHCVVDKANGKYASKEFVYDKSLVSISDSDMNVSMPDLKIAGALNDFQLKANMPNGGLLDVNIKPYGNALYNAGTGKFNSPVGVTGHYALPTMETAGTLTIDGETFEVTGSSWLDRQWGVLSKAEAQAMLSAEKSYGWIWFSLMMDNGDFISVWDFMDLSKKSKVAWATILQPDGTHIVAPIKPLMEDASGYWKSEATGQNYPTEFKIQIPSLDIALDVAPAIREQEIVSVWDTKYEGAGNVTGTYKGKPTKSSSFYELVGNWKS